MRTRLKARRDKKGREREEGRERGRDRKYLRKEIEKASRETTGRDRVNRGGT